MRPSLEEITGQLASVRADLTSLIEHTQPEKFEHRPTDGGWTGTGIIQHLGKVEGASTKLLEGLFAKAMAEGMPMETESKSWLHSLDQYHALDRTVLIEAPERLVPDANAELATSWTSLQAVRQRLLRAVASVDGRDLTVINAPHPKFGMFNGYEWILMVGQHEARHLIQLRETLSEA
jgi:DinB superfamily